MRVVKIEGGYAFKQDIQDAYFYPNEMGNFQVKPIYFKKSFFNFDPKKCF